MNFGFFLGALDDPRVHNVYELFAAVVVSLIATVLKFGDRTQIGAVHLATSLVADLQLIAAALVWGYASYISTAGLTPEAMASVVSLSGGAPPGSLPGRTVTRRTSRGWPRRGARTRNCSSPHGRIGPPARHCSP